MDLDFLPSRCRFSKSFRSTLVSSNTGESSRLNYAENALWPLCSGLADPESPECEISVKAQCCARWWRTPPYPCLSRHPPGKTVREASGWLVYSNVQYLWGPLLCSSNRLLHNPLLEYVKGKNYWCYVRVLVRYVIHISIAWQRPNTSSTDDGDTQACRQIWIVLVVDNNLQNPNAECHQVGPSSWKIVIAWKALLVVEVG